MKGVVVVVRVGVEVVLERALARTQQQRTRTCAAA